MQLNINIILMIICQISPQLYKHFKSYVHILKYVPKLA